MQAPGFLAPSRLVGGHGKRSEALRQRFALIKDEANHPSPRLRALNDMPGIGPGLGAGLPPKAIELGCPGAPL